MTGNLEQGRSKINCSRFARGRGIISRVFRCLEPITLQLLHQWKLDRMDHQLLQVVMGRDVCELVLNRNFELAGLE